MSERVNGETIIPPAPAKAGQLPTGPAFATWRAQLISEWLESRGPCLTGRAVLRGCGLQLDEAGYDHVWTRVAHQLAADARFEGEVVAQQLRQQVEAQEKECAAQRAEARQKDSEPVLTDRSS